jgi:hypothetical protein
MLQRLRLTPPQRHRCWTLTVQLVAAGEAACRAAAPASAAVALASALQMPTFIHTFML